MDDKTLYLKERDKLIQVAETQILDLHSASPMPVCILKPLHSLSSVFTF